MFTRNLPGNELKLISRNRERRLISRRNTRRGPGDRATRKRRAPADRVPESAYFPSQPFLFSFPGLPASCPKNSSERGITDSSADRSPRPFPLGASVFAFGRVAAVRQAGRAEPRRHRYLRSPLNPASSPQFSFSIIRCKADSAVHAVSRIGETSESRQSGKEKFSSASARVNGPRCLERAKRRARGAKSSRLERCRVQVEVASGDSADSDETSRRGRVSRRLTGIRFGRRRISTELDSSSRWKPLSRSVASSALRLGRNLFGSAEKEAINRGRGWAGVRGIARVPAGHEPNSRVYPGQEDRMLETGTIERT